MAQFPRRTTESRTGDVIVPQLGKVHVTYFIHRASGGRILRTSIQEATLADGTVLPESDHDTITGALPHIR